MPPALTLALGDSIIGDLLNGETAVNHALDAVINLSNLEDDLLLRSLPSRVNIAHEKNAPFPDPCPCHTQRVPTSGKNPIPSARH